MINNVTVWLNANNTLITLLFSFLVAISTIVYAILTKKLVSETITMRRIQTDPKICADIISSIEHPFLLNLVIENIGNGTAMNIKFNIIKEPELKKSKKISKYGFIQNGLKSLSGKAKYKTFFCSTIDEGTEFTENEIIMDINYEDIKKRKYNERVIFDLSYLNDIIYIQTDSLYKMAQTIDKIQSSIAKIANKD